MTRDRFVSSLCLIILLPRIKELQNHLSLVEQFDQILLRFSHWSDNILPSLSSPSQVSISNLQSAFTQVKVKSEEDEGVTSFRVGLFATAKQITIFKLHLTGEPGGLTEAVWGKTNIGAAN